MKLERVRAGDVLALQRRELAIDPLKEYRLIGVYSFGKGLFHREPRPGAELGAYRFFRVEPSDLVLSNIQAWEGAIALATDADAGAVGTHRFLSYVARSDRIDTNWARWFFLSEPGLSLIRQAAPGTTMRNRTLATDRFEALEIPLPPRRGQLLVAARLNRIQRCAERLARSSAKARERLIALSVSTASRPDVELATKRRQGWRKVALRSVMQQSDDVVRVAGGESYKNAGIRSFGRGLFKKPDIAGDATSATVLHRIRAGQFIYSRLFAFEGAYAFVSAEFDGYFVSNEFPAFDTDPEQLDARWLATVLRSSDRWADLASSSKGLGVRRQRVPVESILRYEVWLPSIEQQQAMVERVSRLHAVNAARTRADQHIRALLPAALNEAFAGLA